MQKESQMMNLRMNHTRIRQGHWNVKWGLCRIQREFDKKWFECAEVRQANDSELELIHRRVSPFKVELSHYLKEQTVINTEYQTEIDKLKEISEKSITGVITTNYDSFLEDIFSGFTKYVGQSQLIFSAIQGIAEIYKIHGSVELPDSLVINEEDYLRFQEKSAYLAAKLMTIFMEYPIIFLGYSINDSNIRNIIKSIVVCLDTAQLQRLEDRFVFVEYDPTAKTEEVAPYTILIEDKALSMKKVFAICFFSSAGSSLKSMNFFFKFNFSIPVFYLFVTFGDYKFSVASLISSSWVALSALSSPVTCPSDITIILVHTPRSSGISPETIIIDFPLLASSIIS